MLSIDVMVRSVRRLGRNSNHCAPLSSSAISQEEVVELPSSNWSDSIGSLERCITRSGDLRIPSRTVAARLTHILGRDRSTRGDS